MAQKLLILLKFIRVKRVLILTTQIQAIGERASILHKKVPILMIIAQLCQVGRIKCLWRLL
jgi:hypothetical protein